MSSALEFRINLSGNLASSLGKSSHALGETADHTAHARHEFELFESETGKLSGEVLGLSLNLEALGKGGSLFTFDLAEALKGAYELVEKLVDRFIELSSEIVKVAGSTQDLNLAIRLNVGPEQAKEVDELAESFQRTTRFSAESMKKALLPLLKQGVGDKETLDTVATIATDMAARNTGTIQDVQETIAAFAGIFQRGRLKPAQLAQFGIQASDYFKELGSSLGVSAEAAAKMAKQGKVSQDKLADIAVKMIAQRQGGAIGQPTLDADKTLGASLQRLANLKDILFVQAANSPGITAVQEALDKLYNTIKGPIGQQAIAAFDKLLLSISKLALTHADQVFTSLGNAVNFISTALDGNNTTWTEWSSTMSVVIDLAKMAFAPFYAIWKVMITIEGAIIRVGTVLDGFLLKGLGAIGDFVKPFYDKALNLGSAIWQGIRDGVVGGVKHVAQAIEDLGQGAVDSVRSKLFGSRTTATATGVGSATIPAMASGGIVTGPTLALIGEAGPEAVVPLSDPGLSTTLPIGKGGGGRGDTTVSVGGIHITMTGGESPEESGLQAAQMVRIELKKIFDEVGWSYGATVLE